MNHPMYKYISSIILLVGMLAGSSASQAQTYWGPTGIRGGVDVARPFYYSMYEGTGLQGEFSGSIDFTRLMLVADYGLGRIEHKGHHQEKNVQSIYTQKGHYFRVGLDYSFLPLTPDNNLAFLGVRYAMTFFQDTLKSRVLYYHRGGASSDVPGLVDNGPDIDSAQTGVRARWFELVGGVQVKVWNMLYAGCTARYKFWPHIDGASEHTPYELLGWGKHDEQSWGLSYYVVMYWPLKQFEEDKYLDLE